jgi:hypothetical protein
MFVLDFEKKNNIVLLTNGSLNYNLSYVAEIFKSFGAYKPAPVVLRGCVNQMPAHTRPV